jgi:hypothetical protein
MSTDTRPLVRKIQSLMRQVVRLNLERRFLRDSYERLRKEKAPVAQRPEGLMLKIIPKKRLNAGRWYLGIGRGSNVAFWTGREFWYLEEIMGEKACGHWEDGAPFGCFQPFEEIDHRKYGKECEYIENGNSKDCRRMVLRRTHGRNERPK